MRLGFVLRLLVCLIPFFASLAYQPVVKALI
jgi:hypothetical protein